MASSKQPVFVDADSGIGEPETKLLESLGYAVVKVKPGARILFAPPWPPMLNGTTKKKG